MSKKILDTKPILNFALKPPKKQSDIGKLIKEFTQMFYTRIRKRSPEVAEYTDRKDSFHYFMDSLTRMLVGNGVVCAAAWDPIENKILVATNLADTDDIALFQSIHAVSIMCVTDIPEIDWNWVDGEVYELFVMVDAYEAPGTLDEGEYTIEFNGKKRRYKFCAELSEFHLVDERKMVEVNIYDLDRSTILVKAPKQYPLEFLSSEYVLKGCITPYVKIVEHNWTQVRSNLLMHHLSDVLSNASTHNSRKRFWRISLCHQILRDFAKPNDISQDEVIEKLVTLVEQMYEAYAEAADEPTEDVNAAQYYFETHRKWLVENMTTSSPVYGSIMNNAPVEIFGDDLNFGSLHDLCARYFVDIQRVESYITKANTMDDDSHAVGKAIIEKLKQGEMNSIVQLVGGDLVSNVHAEMRILWHWIHDQNLQQELLPYISSSKLCCVHCSLMLHAIVEKRQQTQLVVSGTHACAYPSWAFPETVEVLENKEGDRNLLKIFFGDTLYERWQDIEGKTISLNGFTLSAKEAALQIVRQINTLGSSDSLLKKFELAELGVFLKKVVDAATADHLVPINYNEDRVFYNLNMYCCFDDPEEIDSIQKSIGGNIYAVMKRQPRVRLIDRTTGNKKPLEELSLLEHAQTAFINLLQQLYSKQTRFSPDSVWVCDNKDLTEWFNADDINVMNISAYVIHIHEPDPDTRRYYFSYFKKSERIERMWVS